MKSIAFLVVQCCLVSLLPVQGLSLGLSPVTRVVELLKGLSAKIEEEAKEEEDLYETYVCWAKTVVESKTASNEKAKSRIDSLKQYVDDLENGRIELTSERTDLDAELASLHSDIESAESVRAREHEDYLAAKDEMTKAIAALEEATSVLGEATQSKSEGLLAVKSHLSIGEGFKARQQVAESLGRAVTLGDRFLSQNDARFLRRVLTGDVPGPTKDWKKLNRKATFKMKYKARSSKIQELLKKLLSTFQENLKDSEAKETKAKEIHEKLMASKNEQKSKSQEGLNKMEKEGGARDLSKSDAQDETAALEEQIENDKKYIQETSEALEEKKEEWKKRKALRVGEVAAISKAVSILHSDDARDTLNRSFKSQGSSFYQISQGLSAHAALRRRESAGTLIHALSVRLGDRKLALLAERLSSIMGGRFDKVIEAIDKIIAELEDEVKDDLKTKEKCEKDLDDGTKESASISGEVDELSDQITDLEKEIKEIDAEIADKTELIETTKVELKEATHIRDDEHVEWEKNDKDDKAAVDLLEQAKEVLSNFYKENGMAMLQVRKVPDVVAGEAPPPPPPTWEADYEGKKSEQDGIVGILGMIKDDVEADITKAKEAEDQAQKDYDTFKKDSEKLIEDTEAEIVTLEDDKAKKEEDAATAAKEKATKKGELKVVVQALKDNAVGCNYITVNFKERTQNRELEIEGLKKAKEILEGEGVPGHDSRVLEGIKTD